MGRQQAVDRGFGDEGALPAGEAHRQLARRRLGLGQRQVDEAIAHLLGDAVPDALGPRRPVLERAPPDRRPGGGRTSGRASPAGRPRGTPPRDAPAGRPRGTPRWRRVRRAGRCDRSTRRMISSFSAAGYLIRPRPAPSASMLSFSSRGSSACSAPLKAVPSTLQGAGFLAQRLDPVRRRRARRVAGQAALAGLEELLGPRVAQAFGDALAAAEGRDAPLAAQASPRRPSSTRRIFSSAEWCLRARRRMSRTTRSAGGFLAGATAGRVPGRPGRRISGSSSLLGGYDEPEILRSSTTRFCLIGADAGQAAGLEGTMRPAGRPRPRAGGAGRSWLSLKLRP
jgi:hypothetical protein